MYDSEKECVIGLQILFITCLVLLTCETSKGVTPDTTNVISVSELLVDKNNDDTLDHLGKEVTIAGRATVGSSVLNNYNLYIQDQSAGILFFADTLHKPVEKGDSLIVTGELQLYYGKPEIVVDDYQITEDKSRVPSATPLDITYPKPQQYLGMLVQGKAVITGKKQDENGIRLTIAPSDSSSHSLSIFVSRSHTQFHDFNFKMLNIGDYLYVTGIVDSYTFQDSNKTIYSILPRTPEDIEFAGIPKNYLAYILWTSLGFALLIVGWIVLLKKQVKSKTKEISQALEEKEILMSEIHHRVKNNLAIISGLLQLEAMDWSKNKEVQSVLNESMLRVKSIAMIHEQLYQTEDFANISFDEYVQELTELVSQTIDTGSQAIALEVECDELHININQAIPCALIINELVTNAYEHGFTNLDRGLIKIEVKERDKYLKLVVKDNGKGFPEDFNFNDSSSLGLSMVQQITDQLDGDLNFQNKNGARFEVTFKRENKSGSSSNHFT